MTAVDFQSTFANRMQRLHGTGRRLCAFHEETTAASSVEYAVVLMLVLISMFYGLDCLSHAVNDSFSTVGDSVELAVQPEDIPIDSAGGETERADKASAVRSLAETAFMVGRGAVMIMCIVLLVIFVRRIQNKAAQKQFQAELTGQPQEISVDVIFLKRHSILSILFREADRNYGGRIQVGQVMTRAVTSVLPSASLEKLQKIVRQQRVRHLPVCDSEGKLVGVISDRDLLGRSGGTARELMTANPITIQRDDMLDPAVTLMIRKRISCLPVMHEGQLCGLLTSTDVMMALQCMSQALQRLNQQDMPADSSATVQIAACESEFNCNLTPVAAGAD